MKIWFFFALYSVHTIHNMTYTMYTDGWFDHQRTLHSSRAQRLCFISQRLKLKRFNAKRKRYTCNERDKYINSSLQQWAFLLWAKLSEVHLEQSEFMNRIADTSGIIIRDHHDTMINNSRAFSNNSEQFLFIGILWIFHLNSKRFFHHGKPYVNVTWSMVYAVDRQGIKIMTAGKQRDVFGRSILLLEGWLE